MNKEWLQRQEDLYTDPGDPVTDSTDPSVEMFWANLVRLWEQL